MTRRVAGERADEVWDFVRKQVAQGRQAYIVYPVIEGTKDDQPELDFSRDEAEDAKRWHQRRLRLSESRRRRARRRSFSPKSAQEASPNAKSGTEIRG